MRSTCERNDVTLERDGMKKMPWFSIAIHPNIKLLKFNLILEARLL